MLKSYSSEKYYNALSTVNVAYMYMGKEPTTKVQAVYLCPESLRKISFSITNWFSAQCDDS